MIKVIKSSQDENKFWYICFRSEYKGIVITGRVQPPGVLTGYQTAGSARATANHIDKYHTCRDIIIVNSANPNFGQVIGQIP